MTLRILDGGDVLAMLDRNLSLVNSELCHPGEGLSEITFSQTLISARTLT